MYYYLFRFSEDIYSFRLNRTQKFHVKLHNFKRYKTKKDSKSRFLNHEHLHNPSGRGIAKNPKGLYTLGNENLFSVGDSSSFFDLYDPDLHPDRNFLDPRLAS